MADDTPEQRDEQSPDAPDAGPQASAPETPAEDASDAQDQQPPAEPSEQALPGSAPEASEAPEDSPASPEPPPPAAPPADEPAPAAAQADEPAPAAAQADEPAPAAAEADEPAPAGAQADEPAPTSAQVEEPGAAAESRAGEDEPDEEEDAAPRVKPAIPGADLEVDIVLEGSDPLSRGGEEVDPYAVEDEEPTASAEEGDGALAEPIASAAIDLAAGARYKATGKRKTAIARVILRPGSGSYTVNGRTLEQHFPRSTLQRNIRQPLETVGYESRMDVIARLHGGGISAQAGALRHGISRALLEADPNLRGELKRRGFLTRDSRAKERKKAGLKKARKRPQFSKR